ncbi:MAG: nuclear transport factor 2 family protein [Acidimicrobiia bacterium]|nr:nuclear transport factor 2 family protein [Acidimicrobiia bacterium]MYC44840.1 nuclear transport factor 2 family protein [Acidimicrobiia bacterium]MYI21103.1 nuclear transport factor 2 family protein [Acidimicrobiia bacterium]
MTELAGRSTRQVVEDHLTAVLTGDPVAMASDYAPGAMLVRHDASYDGAAVIAEYFTSVPERLGGGEVVFGERRHHSDGSVSVRWRIAGGPGDGTSGCDTFTTAGGFIVHQTVALDDADF